MPILNQFSFIPRLYTTTGWKLKKCGIIYLRPIGRFYMASFEETQKQLYRSLQPVVCPALQEQVYFNSDGWNHLRFERRRPRSKAEKYYRLSLLPYVHAVISNAPQAKKEVKSADGSVITWSLSFALIKSNTNGKLCKVKVIVIRKKPGGKLYFLSVMCQRKCRNRKKFFGII